MSRTWNDVGRYARIGVGCAYSLIGVALAVNLDHVIENWFVGPARWYNSLYLPLWTGCIAFAATALFVVPPVRRTAIYGALITLPPYGWYLGLFTIERMRGGGHDVEMSGVLFITALAASGALLGPLVVGIVDALKRRLVE